LRKASLTAVDNTLSELEKITAHLITNLNILIHLQILAAALAELERGPRGGDIILIRATDLMRLVHELSQITDVEKHRESLMTIETSVKYVIELNKLQNHISPLRRSVGWMISMFMLCSLSFSKLLSIVFRVSLLAFAVAAMSRSASPMLNPLLFSSS